MLSPLAYYAVLFAVCAYAFLRGRTDERLAATTCIVATFATNVVYSPVGSYAGVETGVLIVDCLALLGFTFIALRTDRFWPLWVAGLQLTTLVGHALKAIDPMLIPQVYAAAARFWVYPIFLIIVFGTWRSHQRHSQESTDNRCPS